MNTLRNDLLLGIQSADRIVEVEGLNVAGVGITQDSVVGLLMGPRNEGECLNHEKDSVFHFLLTGVDCHANGLPFLYG